MQYLVGVNNDNALKIVKEGSIWQLPETQGLNLDNKVTLLRLSGGRVLKTNTGQMRQVLKS